MRIDSSGNVGIGTVTPDANLTVNGVASFAAGTALLPSIARAGDLNTGIWFPAADTIAFTEGGVESMRINSAGDVGIGTSSPTALRTKNLEVSSSGTNDGAAIIANKRGTGIATMRLATVGAADGFDINYNFPNTGMLGFYDLTAATTRVAIDSTGNVGIGTSSPSYKLDVTGQGRATTGFAVSTDGSTFTPSGLNAIPNYGVGYITSTSQTVLSGFGGIPFYTNQLERARIDSSGNVGIGTANPSQKLEVYASANSLQIESIVRNDQSGTGVAAIGFNVSSSAASETTSTKAGIGLVRSNSYGVGSLCFYNNGTTSAGNFTTADEKMRIDSSGNLLVGTTAQAGGALISARSGTNRPTAYFDVNIASSTATPALFLQKLDNNGTTAQIYMQMVYNNGSNGNGQINGNGSGAAAFGSYSDIRLKENIVDLPSQLANIMELRPVEFDWKDGTGHQIGFIAQEVNEVYPDVVGQGADGMLTLTDMNKNDARLIKAIQEQQALIQSLTTRITALEQK
jgi:hypothetical protein